MSEPGADWQVFFEVHSGLPREGPGNRSSTARALEAAQPLPGRPTVLDIACGPGMQTVHIAELETAATVIGVDIRPDFLGAAASRARDAGLAGRVAMTLADMRALPYRRESFDLVWCEGAAYIMGVDKALEVWRPLLKPEGRLAFTDAVWLTDRAPEALRAWWSTGYADMGSVPRALDRVSAAGYRVLDHFVLPEAAWWDDYYLPMEKRLGALRRRYRDDDPAFAVLERCQQEIDYYRRWSAHYGYLFIIAARYEVAVS